MNTQLVGPIVLAGVIFYECALAEKHLDAAAVEQPHIEVTIETPVLLDFSSEVGASGSSSTDKTFSFDAFIVKKPPTQT